MVGISVDECGQKMFPKYYCYYVLYYYYLIAIHFPFPEPPFLTAVIGG